MEKNEQITEMISAGAIWWCSKIEGLSNNDIMSRIKPGESYSQAYDRLIGKFKRDTPSDKSLKKFLEVFREIMYRSSRLGNKTMLETDSSLQYPMREIYEQAGLLGAKYPEYVTLIFDWRNLTLKGYQVTAGDIHLYPLERVAA